MMKKRLIAACFGLFRALSSALLLLRNKCQDKMKRVAGRTGSVDQYKMV